VLATRAIGSFDGPDSDSRIPFYLQSSLGGSQILRGYAGFRFRDHQVIAFSAEYRFEPIPRLEFAVFYDAGQVARERSGLSFGDMHTGWGGGVRIKSTRKVLFRFDVAHSREDTRYLVKLGPSF
jgi:outer membrane protein assembly factor BamA